MQPLSEKIENEIKQLSLLSFYTNPLKNLFFPKSLTRALNQYHASNPPEPKAVWDVYAALDKALAKRNFVISRFYKVHSPFMIDFFRKIAKRGFFPTWKSWAQLISHADLEKLASAFYLLQETPLFTGKKAIENCQSLMQHPEPLQVAFIVSKLHRSDLLQGELGQKNWEQLLDYKMLNQLERELHSILYLLKGQEAQENFQLVLGHENFFEIKSALYQLDKYGLLYGEGSKQARELIAHHPQAEDLAIAFGLAQEYHLLEGQENAELIRQALAKHSNPLKLAKDLCFLQKEGLSHYLREFIHHSKLAESTKAYRLLNKINLPLPQYKTVAQYPHPMSAMKPSFLHHEHLRNPQDLEENVSEINPHMSLFFKPIKQLTPPENKFSSPYPENRNS